MIGDSRLKALVSAKEEAERFIKKADEAIARLSNAKYLASSKEMGAAKRSSMDLTRALVNVRSSK